MPAEKLRIGILAGEASGDILGSRLLVALKQRYATVEAEGIGGPLMAAQGLESLVPMERLSVMGLVEPLKRLPELLRIRRRVYEHFRCNPPDVFLGIDSPDFNLHLEQRLRESGIKTAHLVSPSVWAWRQGRIHKIQRAVDLMLCLYPFETAIYEEHKVPAAFVGHPLADEIPLRTSQSEARQALGLSVEGRLIALLPGSRGGEVGLLGPLFLQCARRLWDADRSLSFVLPAANESRRAELAALLAQYPGLPVSLRDGESQLAMAAADVILLASGTATLEAMLFKRPMVVAYKMGALSWFFISRMVKTPFAALPNILAGRELVPEWLQAGAIPDNICASVSGLLANSVTAQAQVTAFDNLHRSLRLGSAERSAEALATLVEGTADQGPPVTGQPAPSPEPGGSGR